MIPVLDLGPQVRSIESDVRAALDRVFERASFILGEECKAFEQEFAAYLGASQTVGVASGTDAIHLALRAAGVGPGDEVVTVANTCVPTVSGIASSGGAPVLVDAHPDTLTLDPDRLEGAITSRTKAVVPVHLYGHPCDMDAIAKVANDKGIAVIEDCAQAHGALYKDRMCGTLGLAAAFSFYPTKNLGAYGDAGAIVTDDEDLADRARKLRNYGQSDRYHHDTEGFNSRFDEIQAAVLRIKLRRLDAWVTARRELARQYKEALADLPLQLPPEASWAKHAYHLFVIRVPERETLMTHLEKEGVGALIHYPVPIHFQKAFAHLGYSPGDFPVAEAAAAEVLSLPLYPELGDDAVSRVVEAVRAFYHA